jgi:hypothetical protein
VGQTVLLTAALILVLTVAAELFGPVVGGMLAALPVLASVLAVFTHRVHGSDATIGLLGGMLTGMAGFVAFCAAIALLAAPAGTAVAFAVATVCAVVAQGLMLHRGAATTRGLQRAAMPCSANEASSA